MEKFTDFFIITEVLLIVAAISICLSWAFDWAFDWSVPLVPKEENRTKLYVLTAILITQIIVIFFIK